MATTIRPEDEQLIAEVMRTGAYQNADEVIARALEVLRSEEEWLDESRSASGEKIDRAFEQFERGHLFSAEAQNDLFEIWRRIASDNLALAERIDNEFHDLFCFVGQDAAPGHVRKDLTRRPVLFFPLYSFLVVYQAEVAPIRIMAVLRGKRNLKLFLRKRL